MQNKTLSALVFTSGLSVMAVEMTGLRLLAPYFGTSLVVTTILIGSLMGFLSLGYRLGGKYGDKHPTLEALSKVTASAAVCVLLIPLIGRPILKMASGVLQPLLTGGSLEEPAVAFASIGGGMIGILFLFAVPITLMGMVSPWAIRLGVSDVESAGEAAGKLYALSTFGSILGSFLPALALIPLMGVRQTFFTIGALLLGVSLWGVRSGLGKVGAVAGLFLLSFLLPEFGIRPADGVIYESESLYHFIQVAEEPYGDCPNARHLYLNEGVGVHSVKCPDAEIETKGYWTQMAMAPLYLDNPENFDNALIIGLAGGTMARQLLQSFPKVKVDGVEIDGDVVEVGKKYFDNAHPNINPMVMDGRIYLQSVDTKYDLIQIDAYRQPYIPFHLVTQEFFQEVYDHLEDDGVLAINVASVRGVSQDLVAMIFRTIREVFPWAVVVRATRSNDVIIATKNPDLMNKDIDQMSHAKESPRIRQALSRVDALQGLAMNTSQNRYAARISMGIEGWQDAQLLTDDFAPVEMAWDLMTIEFAK